MEAGNQIILIMDANDFTRGVDKWMLEASTLHLLIFMPQPSPTNQNYWHVVRALTAWLNWCSMDHRGIIPVVFGMTDFGELDIVHTYHHLVLLGIDCKSIFGYEPLCTAKCPAGFSPFQDPVTVCMYNCPVKNGCWLHKVPQNIENLALPACNRYFSLEDALACNQLAILD